MKKISREFLKSQHLSTCEMKKTPREFLKSQQLSQRPARAKGGQPPSARSRIGSVKMRLFVHLLLISCLAADAGSDYAITKSSKIKTNESPSSSVRSLGQRRVLSGYVMDDSTIRTAVAAWLSDATAAEATYGHISTWETSGVTDMSWLFCGYKCGGSSWCSDCNSAAKSLGDIRGDGHVGVVQSIVL